MNPLQVIEKAKFLGVSLHLTDKHSIRFKGKSQSIEVVMPLLQANKTELIEWLEFKDLYDHLSPKSQWTEMDYLAWEADLKSSPRLTLECLRALKSSWGREGYGVLEQGDWRSL